MKRKIGETDIEVTPVAMGCWPIAGMTSLNVTREESMRTLETALDSGINFFDTAFCYGPDGESDRLLGDCSVARREQFVIAAKCGIHWDEDLQKVIDGSAERLMHECDLSLSRLQTDYIDLMYLHRPDPKRPIEESAVALAEMKKVGKARAVGLSNGTLEQAKAFHAVTPLSALQLPYNMIEREIEAEIVPWCIENSISLFVYWPLMKGLLAGKIRRDFQFASGDKRQSYPQFQGQQWEQNQLLVDELTSIAKTNQCTIAELVVAWTINQPGITSALCGAKRDWQIAESARALKTASVKAIMKQVDVAVQNRGAV